MNSPAIELRPGRVVLTIQCSDPAAMLDHLQRSLLDVIMAAQLTPDSQVEDSVYFLLDFMKSTLPGEQLLKKAYGIS